MTVPTNIRMNLNAPFPSLVTGSGPISVGKQNGIWQIGYSVAGFGQGDPSLGAVADQRRGGLGSGRTDVFPSFITQPVELQPVHGGLGARQFRQRWATYADFAVDCRRRVIGFAMLDDCQCKRNRHNRAAGLFSAAGGGGIAIGVCGGRGAHRYHQPLQMLTTAFR